MLRKKEELMRKRAEAEREEETLKGHDSLRQKYEKGKAFLLKQKHRAQTGVAYVLAVAGAAVILVILIGTVILQQAETCRYPPKHGIEEFRYTINVSRSTIVYNASTDGKIRRAQAGLVHTLRLYQNFGTYEVVVDPNPDLRDIIFVVSNRARKLSRLSNITNMYITPVNVTSHKGVEETRYNVYLESLTSNRLNGLSACMRSDIKVILPSICLFDETELDIEVTMGDITTRNISGANLDTITLQNDAGEITAHGLRATRVNLNTSMGTIVAEGVASHVVFLLARGEGFLTARDVRLLEGMNRSSCRTETVDIPNFVNRRVNQTTCDTVRGKLTVDTKGGDNDVVLLERIVGGDIETHCRIGRTTIRLMPCEDFAGTFELTTKHGTVSIYEELLINTGKNATKAKPPPPPLDGETTVDTSKNKYHRTLSHTSDGIKGEICFPNGKVAGNQTLTADNMVTGKITVVLLPQTPPPV